MTVVHPRCAQDASRYAKARLELPLLHRDGLSVHNGSTVVKLSPTVRESARIQGKCFEQRPPHFLRSVSIFPQFLRSEQEKS